jgi:hypothetical protein
MRMMCYKYIWSIMWVDRCIYVGAQANRRKVTRCQAMHYLSLRVLTPACKMLMQQSPILWRATHICRTCVTLSCCRRAYGRVDVHAAHL